jgi:hypothetical protein
MRENDMCRNLLVAVLLIFLSCAKSFTQEAAEENKEPVYGWDNKFIGTINLAQSALSNWTKGGDNAWSWQMNINGKFVDKQEKHNWSNTVQLVYGKTQIGSDNPKKTDDQIFMETVYTHRFGNSLNPYVALNVLTQFTAGYKYSVDPPEKVSNFLDPAYLREGIGFEYKPADMFDTRMGFALRQTLADIYAAIYTDDPATPEKVEKLKNQVGLESVTNFNVSLSKLIVYYTKLELFSELERVDMTVVRWDNQVSAKVAEYISVGFTFKLYYEPKVSMMRQLSQTLAVGLTYSFL